MTQLCVVSPQAALPIHHIPGLFSPAGGRRREFCPIRDRLVLSQSQNQFGHSLREFQKCLHKALRHRVGSLDFDDPRGPFPTQNTLQFSDLNSTLSKVRSDSSREIQSLIPSSPRNILQAQESLAQFVVDSSPYPAHPCPDLVWVGTPGCIQPHSLKRLKSLSGSGPITPNTPRC